jgi:hypothetical protein
VHTLLSLQLSEPAPTQLPFEQESLVVQTLPSSQALPLLFELHPVVLLAGVHCWHWFEGFVAPAA